MSWLLLRLVISMHGLNMKLSKLVIRYMASSTILNRYVLFFRQFRSGALNIQVFCNMTLAEWELSIFWTSLLKSILLRLPQKCGSQAQTPSRLTLSQSTWRHSPQVLKFINTAVRTFRYLSGLFPSSNIYNTLSVTGPLSVIRWKKVARPLLGCVQE